MTYPPGLLLLNGQPRPFTTDELAADPAFTSQYVAAPSGATTVTASTYTFVLADAKNPVVGSSASAQTFTVPTNASVAYAVGSVITLAQGGAGAISVAASGGVTVTPAPGATLVTNGTGATVSLLKTGTDTWQMAGNGWARSEVLWLGATNMRVVRGSAAADRWPLAAAEASPPVLLLDAASNEAATVSFIPPWGWNTARVDVYWGNTATSAGDVEFELTYQAATGDGDSWSAGGTVVTVTATAPATSAPLKVTTILASLGIAGAKMGSLGLRRLAADAADTLANDCAVAGIALVRLT